MKASIKLSISTLALVLALIPGLASAETVYQAVLLPASVVPPSSEDAFGYASLIVFADGHATYTINFAGLESVQTDATLMNAARGVNGPILLHLPLGSPVAGTLQLDHGMSLALGGGDLAVQIASVGFPLGVLRGNFVFVTVATEEATWGAIKALFE